MFPIASPAGKAAIMKIRHREARMRIIRGDGSWVRIKTGSGGMQGDAAMPVEFGQTYEHMEKKVIKKNLKRGAGIISRDPLTSRKLEVGTTVFADDVAETKLANGLDELKEEILDSNTTMETALKKQGMAQNSDKAVHIVACMGQGSPEVLRKLEQ